MTTYTDTAHRVALELHANNTIHDFEMCPDEDGNANIALLTLHGGSLVALTTEQVDGAEHYTYSLYPNHKEMKCGNFTECDGGSAPTLHSVVHKMEQVAIRGGVPVSKVRLISRLIRMGNQLQVPYRGYEMVSHWTLDMSGERLLMTLRRGDVVAVDVDLDGGTFTMQAFGGWRSYVDGKAYVEGADAHDLTTLEASVRDLIEWIEEEA